jgi:hypothetical protein
MNQYFATIGNVTYSPINLNEIIEETANERLNINHCNYHPLTNFELTDQNEIFEIINSLKCGSSAGFDKIQISFIKNNSIYFAEYLSTQINTALTSGVFPDSLKLARIKWALNKTQKTIGQSRFYHAYQKFLKPL